MNVTNTQLNEVLQSQILEIDPTGRYVKYDEILGRGPSRTMYKGFDEYEGIEVAWNQIKIDEFQETDEDLERLYSEIDELMELNHKNIMKLYASWIDTANKNINFVTEMFTSGTLREFRQKHKRVNIRAVKNWCRQILGGLVYLHSQEPPIVHRNLGCDNIFINGNQGEVKIGDLGLASILCKLHAGQCIEFMPSEVDREEHNELVDIYAFGICVLEMVTFEYPDDSEFTYSAQIYRRLVSGKKLDALYKVKNSEVQRFIEKCLAVESDRLSARELLMDPFLEISNEKPASEFHHECNYESYYIDSDPYCNTPDYVEPIKLKLPTSHDDDESQENGDITIKGTRGEDDGIFLVIRMPDKEGGARNIYFPFDIESDTAFSVASEMVSELEMNEEDVTKISNMIDSEIVSLLMDNVANFDLNEEYEKEITPTNSPSTKNRWLELRWLKTKYEMQLKEPRDENGESCVEILGF